MSKQKQKGGAFEREVAAALTKIYQEQFIRNISGSGAYIGGKNSFRRASLDESTIRHTRGDVVVPETFKNLNIEAKNYATFEFHLLYSDCHKLLDRWIQQMLETGDENSVDLLAIKITRKGKWVAIRSRNDWVLGSHTLYRSKLHGDWVITDFDEFLEKNSDLLKQISK